MIKQIIQIGLVCTVFALTACGGDTAPAPTPTPTPAPPQPPVVITPIIVPNTGNITVTILDAADTPVANAIVSIGASGATWLATNAQGLATFTGLPNGPIDVHVFNDPTLEAVSFYGVNSNALTIGIEGGIIGSDSVIDIEIAATNVNVANRGYAGVFKMPNEDFACYPANLTQLTCDLWDTPAGTSVTGELILTQGSATSSAGNNISGATEAISLGQQTFTTTATSATPSNILTPLAAVFAVTPPTAGTLVTILPFTAPGGLNANSVSVSGGGITSGSAINPLVLPDTISGIATSLTWSAYDSSFSWSKRGTFTLGGTIDATPLFTTLPSLQTRQAGGTLSWVNAASTSPLDAVSITIENTAAPLPHGTWEMISTSGTTAVLPTLPTGVTGPLVANVIYDLHLFNLVGSGLTVEQFFAGGESPNSESFSITIPGAYTH